MNKDLKSHMEGFFKKGIRLDGRKFDEFREISVETDISKSAEGSCRVKIGDTEVLVGIKFELGKPYPDSQDEGTMMVGAELLPMSNSKFESGPPTMKSIELARVIDRGVRESGLIDFKKLCVVEGEQVWTVIIDLISLNYDGNLFDACGLGALIALKNAKFPKIEGDKVNYKELTKEGIPLTKQDPISITIWKVGSAYLADPSLEEESCVDARLTVAITSDGNICAMQKGEKDPLTLEDIEKMIDLASKKAAELRKHLK
jgi:exosome complex component RRP42